MTQTAPELPEQGDPVDIEATGSVVDGIVTVESQIGGAKMVLTYPAGEEGSDQADLVHRTFPEVMAQVIARLSAALAEEVAVDE